MQLSEITLTITLGLLILSEMRYQLMKSIQIKEMKAENNMLKARIASLEHEIIIRDDLLKEYEYEYKQKLDRNQKLKVQIHESASANSLDSISIDLDTEEPFSLDSN